MAVYILAGMNIGAEKEIRMPAEKLSLYERLGGVYSIATVVDDFIDRIMVDPRLNTNPRVGRADWERGVILVLSARSTGRTATACGRGRSDDPSAAARTPGLCLPLRA